MKKRETYKKLIQMNHAEIIKEKENAQKACNLSRYEVTCKKSENFKKIVKSRKYRAQILTIMNKKSEKDGTN